MIDIVVISIVSKDGSDSAASKKGRGMTAKKHDFGKTLVSLMEAKNLTTRSAAKIVGISQSKIQNWRSGAAPTDFMAVRKLAEVLGTTMSFLLTGEDDSRPDGSASVSEVFKDGGCFFDGYAQITIKRLIPRNEDK